MSINYFEALLKSYDGDSKEVREDLNIAIMREKTQPMQVYQYLLEGLLEETEVKMRRAEINNLLACTNGWQQQPDGIIEAVLDSIKNRVYNLITRPDSYGKHELTK